MKYRLNIEEEDFEYPESEDTLELIEEDLEDFEDVEPDETEPPDMEGEEKWAEEAEVFTPVPVEKPGGGRIKNKTPPNPATLVALPGLGGRRIQFHRLAAAALKALQMAARASGIKYPLLLPVSGYRNPETQLKLWRNALKKYGSPEKARKWVAPPGGSAHQTGRAIDFYLGGSNSSANVSALRTLPVYKWLAANAKKFGFYPYIREPWHWEYNPPVKREFEIYPEINEAVESFEDYEDEGTDLSLEFDQEMQPTDQKSFRDYEFLDDNREQEVTPQIPFYKDSPQLKLVPLKPSSLIKINPSWASIRKGLARTYNRLGGLMQASTGEIGIEHGTALAVWQIESGGRIHITGKAIIRFENHLFYKFWGKSNQHLYNEHFHHGGHYNQPGKSWQNHQFRENSNDAFITFHGNQSLEYRVLNIASRLAGEDIALRCISIGGPQILISNFRLIGYSSPREMYEAFQTSERAHVLGFFDFCRQKKAPQKGDLFIYLKQHKWAQFAKYYNGLGQYQKYGDRIGNAYSHAKQILI